MFQTYTKNIYGSFCWCWVFNSFVSSLNSFLPLSCSLVLLLTFYMGQQRFICMKYNATGASFQSLSIHTFLIQLPNLLYGRRSVRWWCHATHNSNYTKNAINHVPRSLIMHKNIFTLVVVVLCVVKNFFKKSLYTYM